MKSKILGMVLVMAVVVGFCGNVFAYNISGQIKLINNGPAVEAVAVHLTAPGQSVQICPTNSNGEYSFADLPRGNYTITPLKQDWIFVPTNISITNLMSDLTGQDFSAKYTRNEVSGYIRDENGEPVIGMPVKLWNYSTLVEVVFTGAGGYYEFTNVISGLYTITPGALGWVVDPLNRCVGVMANNIENINFRARCVVCPQQIVPQIE